MSNPIGVIAEGFLPTGQGAGVHSPYVTGAVAIADGSGGWQITVSAPWAGIADSDVIIDTNLGTATNLSGGISLGLGTAGGGVYQLNAYRNDTHATVDVNLYFSIRLRR